MTRNTPASAKAHRPGPEPEDAASVNPPSAPDTCHGTFC